MRVVLIFLIMGLSAPGLLRELPDTQWIVLAASCSVWPWQRFLRALGGCHGLPGFLAIPGITTGLISKKVLAKEMLI